MGRSRGSRQGPMPVTRKSDLGSGAVSQSDLYVGRMGRH